MGGFAWGQFTLVIYTGSISPDLELDPERPSCIFEMLWDSFSNLEIQIAKPLRMRAALDPVIPPKVVLTKEKHCCFSASALL